MSKRVKASRKSKKVGVIVNHPDSEKEYSSDFNSRIIAEKKRRARELRLENDIGIKLAESRIYFRWFYYDGNKALFPLKKDYRYVDRRFPWAKGGELLFDEPQDAEDIKACKLKAAHLQSLGIRYIYVTPGMSFEDAIIRLEEMDKCLTGQLQQTT